MPVVEKQLLGTIATLGSTELNSLANNALVALPAFSNVIGGAGDGYLLAEVELVVTFTVAPGANTGVPVWLLAAPDGTNYEDGSASITPARNPELVFPVRAVTTAQRITRRILLPQGLMTPLLKNDGTGQAFAATGNTLKIRPATPQGV